MKELQAKVYELLRLDGPRSRGNRRVTLLLVFLILLATAVVIINSFNGLPLWWWVVSLSINLVVTVLFSAEYLLRLWVAPLRFPQLSPLRARLRHILSPMAIIDLLSILPLYLVMFTKLDVESLYTLRLLRLFVLLKFNRYFHTLDTVIDVVKVKRRELLSSFMAVFSLMLISSAMIYSVEGQVQPDKFPNILSGMWWAVSTLLTIGYGDIYPITALGKVLAAIVAVLGVGMIAVPTGIVSAGFVEVMDKKRAENDEKLRAYRRENPAGAMPPSPPARQMPPPGGRAPAPRTTPAGLAVKTRPRRRVGRGPRHTVTLRAKPQNHPPNQKEEGGQ